ncbi:uncharacterized protein LOC117171635 isoform X1 [Belonocnema kinseyi]|uniref:uncharacterized protein LOC117171635 isoform X1 n=1 Tax=Belonocnema kinseyi TaxID=2817044 RepID=UPI00143D8D2A|nr:uncharacterized protein LOC117171635 isoform X1 [Belonocnema kinseyi]
MASKFETEFITPWNFVKAREQIYSKLFNCEVLEPLASRHKYTYFNNQKEEKSVLDKRTAYDRLHDFSQYDIRKTRCDRKKQSTIWQGIHEENKNKKVGMTTSLWYGRPNRVQIDFSERKYCRTTMIQDAIYRKHDLNLSPDLERRLL